MSQLSQNSTMKTIYKTILWKWTRWMKHNVLALTMTFYVSTWRFCLMYTLFHSNCLLRTLIFATWEYKYYSPITIIAFQKKKSRKVFGKCHILVSIAKLQMKAKMMFYCQMKLTLILDLEKIPKLKFQKTITHFFYGSLWDFFGMWW